MNEMKNNIMIIYCFQTGRVLVYSNEDADFIAEVAQEGLNTNLFWDSNLWLLQRDWNVLGSTQVKFILDCYDGDLDVIVENIYQMWESNGYSRYRWQPIGEITTAMARDPYWGNLLIQLISKSEYGEALHKPIPIIDRTKENHDAIVEAETEEDLKWE